MVGPKSGQNDAKGRRQKRMGKIRIGPIFANPIGRFGINSLLPFSIFQKKETFLSPGESVALAEWAGENEVANKMVKMMAKKY